MSHYLKLDVLVHSLALLAAILAMWWVASHFGFVNRLFLPSPEATLQALHSGLRDGVLAGQGMETSLRMFFGWLLASIAGVALGAAIGISPVARRLLQPTLEFVRPLPISALIPVAAAIIGLNAKMVLTVVAFGAMWPVLLATVHGFANIEPRLLEVARCLAIPRPAFIWKMGLPNAMPDILTGMRLSMTVSLTLAVVGEMITSQEGLGQAMLFAARTFRADNLFASIAIVTLIGFGSNGLLGTAERRLLRWQRP